MKNKKLLGLLIGLVCISFCFALMLTACRDVEKDPGTTQPAVTDPVTKPTTGEPSEPEVTQPEQTEPMDTQPEDTQPDETEPEETQPSGSSDGPNVNTGTGGGYDPGASDPTEPEDATQPEIVVPAAGSENNAYAEYVPDGAGTFTTVTIPAGEKMYYQLHTSGSFLHVEDGDAEVIWNETVYQAENGVLEIALLADETQSLSLVFRNKDSEEKSFAVEIRDVVGSKSNPIVLNSVADIRTELSEGDADGVYYSWTADRSGILKMALGSVEGTDAADAVITVKGTSVRLSDGSGVAQLPVKEGEEVILQVLTQENAEGVYPQAQIQIGGYVAVIVDMEISQIPTQVESVTVDAGQSVILRITGSNRKSLKIADSDFAVLYDGVTYTPDAQGVLQLNLPDSGTVELELINQGAEPKTTQLFFNYPMGHELNPYNLTALGQLAVSIPEDQEGYWYSYTAPVPGMVTFQMCTYPEMENVKTDIVITNQTTGESTALWSEDESGEAVENPTVSLPVNTGDELTVWVLVTDIFGYSVFTDLEVSGELYGTEELPILVEYPGFTAYVPAGTTLYYEGYNMADLLLTLEGTAFTVSHNGTVYTPDDGKVTFPVVTEGRNPARFAITNTGSEMAAYTGSFAYPVGHAQNPAALVLGTNTVTRTAGASDFYYTFTAPRSGTITFTFDPSAQWVYAVDNLTQGVYGDSQWSDSDPLMNVMTLTVKAKDQLQIRVNTYDAAYIFENPAGTVVFDANYVSGPTTIRNTTVVTYAVLIPGEGGMYTGDFHGLMLKVSGAHNAAVVYDGVRYTADAAGNIAVRFPAEGSGNLQYTVYNTGTAQSNLMMQFSSGEVGTAANPESIGTGSFQMVQDEEGGDIYYYEFVATTKGTMIITFETDVDALYLLNGSILKYTHMGQNSYRLAVREGQVVSLAVNTYDPSNPRVAPEGIVDFTIEVK